MREEPAVVTFRSIPNLKVCQFSWIDTTPEYKPLWRTDARLIWTVNHAGRAGCGGGGKVRVDNFACLALAEKQSRKECEPTPAQLAKHPLALLAYVPRDVAIFAAGAVAGAAAKTVTAPLDRIKLLMQVLFMFITFELFHVFLTFLAIRISLETAPSGLIM